MMFTHRDAEPASATKTYPIALSIMPGRDGGYFITNCDPYSPSGCIYAAKDIGDILAYVRNHFTPKAKAKIKVKK